MPKSDAVTGKKMKKVTHEFKEGDRKSSPANLVSKTPRTPGACTATPEDDKLELPHERDQASDSTASAPDPAMKQAHEDLKKGLVDTDMRATPGLDAERRARQVPGPGGQPPRPGAAPRRKV